MESLFRGYPLAVMKLSDDLQMDCKRSLGGNHSIQDNMSWCIMGLFLKFGVMTLFLILILTYYEKFGGDGSNYFINWW